MSYEDKEKADNLDRFLAHAIPQIEKRISQKGLLKLKGKSGAIKLWYTVGVELRALWETVRNRFDLPDTSLPIFIKAVYDHSDKIRPGSGRSNRFRNAYLYYCYLVAGFPWEMVETSGNWTAWVEFLDSRRIREDPRIIEWFADRKAARPPEKKRYSKLQWFRKITRKIRNELKEIDTTVLKKDELFRKLDRILECVASES